MHCVQVRSTAKHRSQTYYFHVKKLQWVVLPSGTLASIAKVSDSLPHQASQLTTFLGLLIMPAHSCTLYAPPVDELHLW